MDDTNQLCLVHILINVKTVTVILVLLSFGYDNHISQPPSCCYFFLMAGLIAFFQKTGMIAFFRKDGGSIIFSGKGLTIIFCVIMGEQLQFIVVVSLRPVLAIKEIAFSKIYTRQKKFLNYYKLEHFRKICCTVLQTIYNKMYQYCYYIELG